MSFYNVDLAYREDAAHYYAALSDLPWAIWLDSCGMSRFDILTAVPQQTLLMNAEVRPEDPFVLMRSLLGERGAPISDIPFAGGVLGYWSYDLVRHAMCVENIAQNDTSLPLMAAGLYDWALVLDHWRKTARLVSHCRFPETAKLLPEILRRLVNDKAIPADTFRVNGYISANFTPDDYASAFAKVQEYLHTGDCYQINLAQRFSAQAGGDAFGAYLELRRLSPAPYSAFLNLPQAQVLCGSPEGFLQIRDGRVVTRPIKGTRPRGRDVMEDRRLAEELQENAKDRAENLMIVDLLRNDLGKSCEPGSVRVPELFKVESYANVQHLVSTVEGRLRKGRDAIHVLQDCFPGGSVTGAPKRRAMQIIEQLEPHRRGIYCGSIGYIGFDGNMETNIAIRTMLHTQDTIHCWAGGGIVADSQCEAEYQETFDKAAAMLSLLRRYGGITSSPY